MAILIPSMKQIKASKPYPEEGELEILRVLQDGLDDSYHIFFQSYLNGLHPDVVILRDGYGVFIIEVKDWELNLYNYLSNEKWELKNVMNFVIKILADFIICTGFPIKPFSPEGLFPSHPIINRREDRLIKYKSILINMCL